MRYWLRRWSLSICFKPIPLIRRSPSGLVGLDSFLGSFGAVTPYERRKGQIEGVGSDAVPFKTNLLRAIGFAADVGIDVNQRYYELFPRIGHDGDLWRFTGVPCHTIGTKNGVAANKGQ